MKGVVQFVLSMLIGWFAYEYIFTWLEQNAMEPSRRADKSDTAVKAGRCACEKSKECFPCGIAAAKSVKNKTTKEPYRSEPFKPTSFNEDPNYRWGYYRDGKLFERIKNEPAVGANGVRKLQFQAAIERSKTILADNYSTAAKQVKLEDFFTRDDPFTGSTYFVNLVDQDNGKRSSVEFVRGFLDGAPRMLDVKLKNDVTRIDIVSTVFQATERLEMYLSRLESSVFPRESRDSLGLKLVFFDTDQSLPQELAVLSRIRERNPGVEVEHFIVRGGFNRAAGLHVGAEKCKDDVIVLFLDVDMHVTSRFIDRVRANVIRNESVWFPIAFSQYDPDVISEAARRRSGSRREATDTMEISGENGFWIHYAYGISAMFKSDYTKAGGWQMNRQGWGGEDVDFFVQLLADPGLQVISSVDPDLIHVYHSRKCDPDLTPDQYRMCVGAWSDAVGSQMDLAALLLLDRE